MVGKRVAAVVLAGGASTRFGDGGARKQFVTLDGLPVWAHSVRTFGRIGAIGEVVVVVSSDALEATAEAAARLGVKVDRFVAGGGRRQDSALNGLKALADSGNLPDTVLIHDGARPLVSDSLIKRVLAAAEASRAVVPALRCHDTIKLVEGESVTTQARSVQGDLYLAQTPQAFDFRTIYEAHQAVADDVTDDAAMCERVGVPPTLVAGEVTNIKITVAADMARARQLLPATGTFRWGSGYDAHKFAPSGPLRLGGVDVQFDRHLDGHSDGDVVLHAIADALLGAAGLGDLGEHFPSTDEWAGDSAKIVVRAQQLGAERGWQIEHIDVTIIAEVPRLSQYRFSIAERIASLLQLPAGSCNVKITSTDGLGEIGLERGIAAQATATLRRG